MCVELAIKLNEKIEEEFKPLNWIDTTIWQDDGTGSISFTDDGEPKDQFFDKMYEIKEFVKTFGYTAELIKFPADCECPYHEARININFHGGEL